MSFLVPLFVGGLALLVVPWLVHRIRRPERETVRFSSLMFVPDIKREVIERRRVQHILLMVLRMALLALLAFAFMRPFQEVFFSAEVPADGGTHHVILLDASLSMGNDVVWARAKQEAFAILDEVKTGDQIGLIRFAQRARVDVPLTDDVSLIRQALEGAEWTWEKGDDLIGLQAAADLLTSEQDVQRVVHLVSDFQATGLPDMETGWALPGHMRLHPVVVGQGDWHNASVDALALRDVGDQTLQVRARIKNWQGNTNLQTRLWLNGQVADTRMVSVLPGHASQVRFDVSAQSLEGFVEVVDEDGLGVDNKYYFTFQPAPKQRVVVLKTGTLHRLMQAAVPQLPDMPWQIDVADETQFASIVQSNPSVVVVGQVSDNMVALLRDYVQAGGQVFLPLQKEARVDVMNTLLSETGLQVAPSVSESQRVPLAWVDLKHRIFYPFRGAKFNDFSSVRYSGYHRLVADDNLVLARFEGDDVMMAEGTLGKGRFLVWAGGVEMNRSNLARSSRFVPLLHETLRYLAGEPKEAPSFVVGDVVTGVSTDQPGIRSITQGVAVAVNVDGDESDPTQISPAEFEIRMCEAPVLYREGEAEASSVVGGEVKNEEYGHWILMVMVAFLLFEHFYAAWIESHPKREHA